MSAYRLSEPARRDMSQIRDFIAQDDPEFADRTVLDLAEAMERLAEFPQMGKPRDDLGVGPFSFPVRSHVIFYREDAHGVEILRVIHSSRDSRRIFP